MCDRKVKWVDQSLAFGSRAGGKIGNAGPGVMKWNLLTRGLVVVVEEGRVVGWG